MCGSGQYRPEIKSFFAFKRSGGRETAKNMQKLYKRNSSSVLRFEFWMQSISPDPETRFFGPPVDFCGPRSPGTAIWGVKNQNLKSWCPRLLLVALIRRQKCCFKNRCGSKEMCAKTSLKIDEKSMQKSSFLTPKKVRSRSSRWCTFCNVLPRV